MRLVIPIYCATSMIRMQKLYDENEFVQSILFQENTGSWWIDADNEKLGELERLLESKSINYKIKE